jgi:predicted permease
LKVFRRLICGLTALIRRDRVEQELDDELQAYLEAAIEEHMRAGMRREDAVRHARVQMGSLEAVKDHTRDVGWETRLESVWRDGRYAVRALRKSPAFTATAVVTLALGIGANTAIFSAVNAIMLRQLPVERPEELVSLAAIYPNGVEPIFSYAAYRRFAADAAPLVDAIAASAVRRAAITLDGPPEAVDFKWVSGNYFTMLGLPAGIGRTLVVADDRQPPGERVAVLSDAFWTRRFGRDPRVLGRSFRLQGMSFTIVGVAPPGFTGESPGETSDVWMPLTAQPGAPSWLWNGHSTTWLRILARRQAGVTTAQARAGLEAVYMRVRDDIAAGTESSEFRASVLASRLDVSEASRGASRLRDNLSGPLLVLMAIVGLVLLVACANVANLMLARSVAKRRETAVCLAIGAGRLRLVRQGLVEALLLAVFGGLGGLFLAMWGASVLEVVVSGAFPISLDVSPDLRVFAFAGLVACATALMFGLLPVLSATRIDPLGFLKAGGGPARGTTRIPLGRTLVVAQISVSLVLLVAAGLFVRSLIKLREIDTGFDPNRVLLFRLAAPVAEEAVPLAARRNLYRQLLQHAEGVPGVSGASASFTEVFSRDAWGNAIAVEGFVPPAGVVPRTFANSITPDFFDVMRIAVLRGRGFTDADHETAPKVAVVNETFARQFFGESDAIGRRVGLCSKAPCGTPTGMMAVVGVAEDAKYTDLRETKRPMLYVPFTQYGQNLSELQVRTAGEPATVARTLYRELAAFDRRLTVVAMMEAHHRVDASLVAESLVAKFSATFGVLALALAVIGLYGLVAYAATQRTAEIGIRMALGAGRGDVRRLVLRDTFTLLVIGLLIGIPAALAAARLVASQLHEVAPNDLFVLSVGLLTLSGAAIVAGYLPARRAARLDPSVVLRAE